MNMKSKLIILFLVLSMSLFAQTSNPEFDLIVSGIESVEGNLLICVIDNAKEYKKATLTYKVYPVTDTVMTIHFNDFPAGTYAIKVIWDKNSDFQVKFKHGDKIGNSGEQTKKAFAKFEMAKFDIPQTKEVKTTLRRKEK